MAKHRADRHPALVGETDPNKIRAEMQRIEAEAAQRHREALDRIARAHQQRS